MSHGNLIFDSKYILKQSQVIWYGPSRRLKRQSKMISGPKSCIMLSFCFIKESRGWELGRLHMNDSNLGKLDLKWLVSLCKNFIDKSLQIIKSVLASGDSD